VEKERYAE
jgi:hypothetical protein